MDADAEETARDLMVYAARHISLADIRRDVGGREDLEQLTDAEYEQFLADVADAIEQADVEITL